MYCIYTDTACDVVQVTIVRLQDYKDSHTVFRSPLWRL